jgi:anti-anti-sigma factor
MDIAEEKDGEAVVLTPDGDLNTPQECGVLERKLAQSIESGARALVIDCQKAPRVSAAAIRLLLLMQRRLGQLHGCLVLCGLGDIVRRVFAISGFDRDFTIVVAREDAVARALAGAAERRLAAPWPNPRPPLCPADSPVRGWFDRSTPQAWWRTFIWKHASVAKRQDSCSHLGIRAGWAGRTLVWTDHRVLGFC